jgi:hypothetical protein
MGGAPTHLPAQPPPRHRGDVDKGLLTAQEVSEMTGLSVHTLTWWRFPGSVGPAHTKLGTRT